MGTKDEVAPLVVVLACEELIEVSEDCKIEGVVLEGDELSDCEEDEVASLVVLLACEEVIEVSEDCKIEEVEETLPVEQAVSSKVKNVAWVIFIN